MASLPLPTVSVDYYLGFEEGNSEKHEFVDGYMVAMAGASPDHSTITSNVSIAIGGRLNRSHCRGIAQICA